MQRLLAHLINARDWHQARVFTRTKQGANRLAEQLNRNGITSAAIHDNKSQTARTRALQEVKSNKLKALVATDIAARGQGIERLPHVINYDPPQAPEDYVHRVGRIGRTGSNGAALSLVSPEEHKLFQDSRKRLTLRIPIATAEGFEHRRGMEPIVDLSHTASRLAQTRPKGSHCRHRAHR